MRTDARTHQSFRRRARVTGVQQLARKANLRRKYHDDMVKLRPLTLRESSWHELLCVLTMKRSIGKDLSGECDRPIISHYHPNVTIKQSPRWVVCDHIG